MFPVIQLGPLAVQTPGLILLSSIWIGMLLAEKHATHNRLKPPSISNLILFSLISFLVGGRLTYATLHWDSFHNSPLDFLSINTSLFDPTGGFTLGLIVAFIHGQRKGLPFWQTLDALTPFFATAMVGIGASHMASGNAFGRETSLPWGIELHGAQRHPSQIYEVAVALAILLRIGLRKPSPTAGIQFLVFLAWSAGARLVLESFHRDSIIIPGGLRLVQILAWIILAVTLISMERLQSHQRKIIIHS